ncbi:dTMP kinase [Streptomyces sp. DW26H14]|uniref:dTMP kinase n=1 Tax=Streptomyces sp. DW26H14 TaxID=3435395 RepID=UPI00403D9E85
MTPLYGAYAPGSLPHREGPFIVLEGISGIGKSTLAKLLTDRLDASTLHTVPEPFTPWAPVINNTTAALPQFAFYLSGALHSADLVRGLLSRGPVVADRYISSVIAHHSAVHQLDMSQVRALLAPYRPYLLRPDRTFYLRCDDSTLHTRMAGKTDFNKDDHDMLAVPGRLDRLRANFDAVATEDQTAIVIDTDGRSPEALADLIAGHLQT